jgi:uncharacterized membrane protein
MMPIKPQLPPLPKIPSPPSGFMRPLAIAACLAGIVHIGATFAMPMLAGNSAYGRLAKSLPLNALAVFPPVTPSTQPLAFLGADARYAMCRYDTTEGPVGVDVTLPGAGWLLALYTPAGDNFYYVPGQDDRAIRLSLLLVPPGDQPISTSGEDPSVRSGTQSIVATQRGLLVVRAPLRGAAYDAEIAATLRDVRCVARPVPHPR